MENCYSNEYARVNMKKSKENCRACSDFKVWAKEQSVNLKQKQSEQKECPLDREELGRSSWKFLHTMAAYFPNMPSAVEQKEMKEFMYLFSKFFPCNDCAEDLQKELKSNPPVTLNRQEFSQWMCRIHNNVNVKLGKPAFDCSLVDERWLNGWKDGSCG